MIFDAIPTLAPNANRRGLILDPEGAENLRLPGLPPTFDPLSATDADLDLWNGLNRPSQETLIEWASHRGPNEFKYIDPREESHDAE